MEDLTEIDEDAKDLAAVIARRDEPTISQEDLRAELRRAGIIAAEVDD